MMLPPFYVFAAPLFILIFVMGTEEAYRNPTRCDRDAETWTPLYHFYLDFAVRIILLSLACGAAQILLWIFA